MKKVSSYIIILFSFLSLTSFSQQYGWKDISANMPEQASLNDIHVRGEEVWISGGNDKVYYTPDGGETFQIQSLPENSGISSSIFMKNNQEGYCVTYSGCILKTDDGGTNWHLLHNPGGTLNSLHFPPSSSTGYTCGENGKVYSFSNTDIVDISPAGIVSSLQSIYFPVDTSEGKLCGQNIIRRYFGGSWDNLQFFDNGFLYNSIFFTDNSNGWAVGSQGQISKTTDGLYWVSQNSNTTKNLNDILFINSLEGWVVGSGILLQTTDGGVSWTQELESLTAGKELIAIYFTSAHNAYIIGNGVVLKYGEVFGIAEEASAIEFELFPNPCQDEINLRYQIPDTRKTRSEIIDITGCVVKSLELQGQENTVDVSDLPQGIYFVKLQTGDKVGVRKIIIQ